MKICSKCGASHSSTSSYCPACHSKYMRAWYKKNAGKSKIWTDRRRAEIRKIVRDAKSVPCTDCGVPYPWYCMDFDHVRGKKEFDLATASNRRKGIEDVLREIKKCDPVCANCHRKRTYRRGCKEFKD